MIDMFVGFQATKIKPALKMAIQRIEIHKNKKANYAKAQKREIAVLLKDEKEEKARIRVEGVIRDDFKVEAMEIISLMCELIHERIMYLSSESQCPDDLKEAVSTVIWAASRLEVDELQTVKKQLSLKYGSSFTRSAEEGSYEARVNIRVVEKLTVKPPSMELVARYLGQIAKENNFEWVPTDQEENLTRPAPSPSGFSIPMAPASDLHTAYQKNVNLPPESGEGVPLGPPLGYKYDTVPTAYSAPVAGVPPFLGNPGYGYPYGPPAGDVVGKPYMERPPVTFQEIPSAPTFSDVPTSGQSSSLDELAARLAALKK